MPGLLTQQDGDKENDDDDDDATADGGDATLTAAVDTPVEVLLLVDASNGFNNLSRYGMLWTVRHRCPKLSRFTFNCYRHEVTLICRDPGGHVVSILFKEWVTQGDHLAKAVYNIALLPLAELLREKFPNVPQL